MKRIFTILLFFITLTLTSCSLITNSIIRGDIEDKIKKIGNTSIFFDSNSYYVNSHYSSIIEDIALFLSKNRTIKVILNGYADINGSSEYNIALGQRRINSVYEIMRILGVSDSQIEFVSFGKEKFYRSNDTFENDLTKNRRVDLIILN